MTKSSECDFYCPDCHSIMKYRDSRPRIMRQHGGVTHHVMVERYYCRKCHHLHTILPDFLVPYKHYSSEVIQDVLDEVVDEETPEDADGPSPLTMKEWKLWFKKNFLRMEALAKTAILNILGLEEEIPEAGGSLLRYYREHNDRWLAVILRYVYNSGGFLVPFRSWKNAPAFE